MKHLKPFVLEQALITRKGKIAYADEQPLRGVEFSKLGTNLCFAHFVQGNFMMRAGKFWLYLVSDPAAYNIPLLNAGKVDMLMFPPQNVYGRSIAPITDVWKKSHTKQVRGAEHILGLLEGYANESEILVAMMSVRPEFKRNRINTIMIDGLQRHFPDAELVFEDPTEDGVAYIKQAYPTARVKWNSRFRPQNWDHETDQPR